MRKIPRKPRNNKFLNKLDKSYGKYPPIRFVIAKVRGRNKRGRMLLKCYKMGYKLSKAKWTNWKCEVIENDT